MIVVDSTVWIDFFRGSITREISTLRSLMGLGVIRKAALDRFTIDRLVKIHNRLDRSTRIRVGFSHSHEGERAGATHL